MSWEELFPIVSDQAYWAVMRYDARRADKIQELLAQSYMKFQNDVARGKEIKKQDYKCFITQRAKEVDQRSICKDGLGGNSIRDVLSFYRRRTEGTEIVAFDEWLAAKPRAKEIVEEQISFTIDFQSWQQTLCELEIKVLNYLMIGYKIKDISEMLKMTYVRVKNLIRDMKISFLNFFAEPNEAYSQP
jgi:hypothetical protein